MQYLIESAIERETQLLDAVFEGSVMLEVPTFQWQDFELGLQPQARKFSSRGISSRRFSTRAVKSRREAVDLAN